MAWAALKNRTLRNFCGNYDCGDAQTKHNNGGKSGTRFACKKPICCAPVLYNPLHDCRNSSPLVNQWTNVPDGTFQSVIETFFHTLNNWSAYSSV